MRPGSDLALAGHWLLDGRIIYSLISLLLYSLHNHIFHQTITQSSSTFFVKSIFVKISSIFNMNLLSTFSVNEKVQALDETTWIWEAAVIRSFVSDWEMTIKWEDWGAKHKPVNIEVPAGVQHDIELWKVRKPRMIEKKPLPRTRSSGGKKEPAKYTTFIGNPVKVQRFSEVSQYYLHLITLRICYLLMQKKRPQTTLYFFQPVPLDGAGKYTKPKPII